MDGFAFFVEKAYKKSNKILQKCEIKLDIVINFTYNDNTREYKKQERNKAAYGSVKNTSGDDV